MAQPRRNLSVELRVVNFEDPHPTRDFILRSPTYAIRIGRGSKSGNRELFPGIHNAWFESRVMSREHAVLKADPDTRCVYIEDVGSMHGTYVEDRRIAPHERQRLYDDDVVKFGNEVTRGPESFPPLHVVVRYSWVDDSFGRSLNPPRMSQAELLPNTFQVPDYDEEDLDDEIAFIQETVLKPKLEVAVPPPTCCDRMSGNACIEDAISAEAGQGLGCASSIPDPPLASHASSPLPRSYDSSADSSSIVVHASVTASGPSGLTEAERQADKRALDLDEHPTSSAGASMSTDPQSPTRSNSSPIASSQTQQTDECYNGKLKLLVDGLPSHQPTSPQEIPAVVDVDLTQSEADSDEAYSPDLMVDDSEEEGQRRDTLTDYGSDSGVEALLADEDRSSSVVFIAADSTNSESNRSEYSDDIGMECDEDFFDDTENKTPRAKEVLPHDTYNDGDKATTEQVSIPYNMRPGNFTMPSTRLNLPSNPLNRAPSPSDAAMAKPCDFQTGGPGGPSGVYMYSNQQSWATPMTSAYGSAWSCALDGRNHAPYDERFGGYQYPYGAGYASGQLTSDSFRAYPTQSPMLADQSFNPDQNSIKQPDRPSGGEMHQGQQPSPISISNTPNQTSTEVACPPHDLPKSTAKVSIDNIVQKLSNESLSAVNVTKLKRKAEEMTSDTIVKPAFETSNTATQAQVFQPLTSLPQSKIASFAQIKAFQVIPSASRFQDDRPAAKRARTIDETRKTSFATLAATALAGAVVGGVGVVAALVSLPQDFFV